MMMKLVGFVFILFRISTQENYFGFADTPCAVVFSKMRNFGFLVRDCIYMDPFVYWRIEHATGWNSARSICQKIPSGELVSITDFQEKRLVSAMAENNLISSDESFNKWGGLDQGVWIGLKKDFDQDLNSTIWNWSDGERMVYDDWLTGHPIDQEDSSCSQVVRHVQSKSGLVAVGWTDADCSISAKSICKGFRKLIMPQ